MVSNRLNSPEYKGQGKNNHFQVQNKAPVRLNPVFDDLTPDAIISHISELQQAKPDAPIMAYNQILARLLDQIEPLDFEALTYPEAERLKKELQKVAPDSEQAQSIQRALEKLKLSTRHYLILAVEHILALAEKNRWGLCKKHDFIYLYNGAYWTEIEKEDFQKCLGEAAEKMGIGKFTARFYKFREGLFKQFHATAYLPAPEIRQDVVLINLSNGTFEITPQGSKLRHFDRADFLTYQLPFAYDPNAKAPIFQQYLDKVLPDKQAQCVLAEYLGFLFIRHGSSALKEEKALILYGLGSNGKSVLFEVINALLGKENVTNYSLQSLTNENGYSRAKIANKLVNYASEISVNMEAAIFKQLVSGEPVEARLPYGEPFLLRQYAKLIFNCNELPKDVEHTNAYFRRFLILPFDVTIPEHEQDKNLHRKITENELSGVFNWILEGLTRLLQQKRFSECLVAQKALDKYKLESDSVRMFLNDNNYTTSPTGSVSLKDLFSEYRTYCMECLFKPCSNRTFADRLRNIGYIIERKSHGNEVNAIKIFNL